MVDGLDDGELDDDEPDDDAAGLETRELKNMENMTPQEKIAYWQMEAGQAPAEDLGPPEDNPDLDDQRAKDSPENDVVSFVTATSAFQWLVAMLRRNLALALPEASAFNDVSATVASALKFRRGHAALNPEEATIVTRWAPRAFVREQEYECYESLITALAITGEALKGQMTNSIQYMEQTWPLTGRPVLEGLISAIVAGAGTAVTSKLTIPWKYTS